MGSRQKLMQISNQLRSEVVRLNEGERKMREYITSVENVISGLNDQLVEAEAAESTALAEEDYAKAEEISTRSAALKKELEAKHAEIQTCLQRNGQATQMRVTKIQNELVTIDAMIKGFDAAYTSVNGMFEEMVKKLDEQSAAHDARLAQMMNVINEKEEALAKSREAIAAEKEVIEEKIREDCVDLYKEKEEAGMLKLTLDEEIASLKQQLHQKNQELLACTKHIAETDQKIQQVRVKYLPQFQPIEEKNKALSGDVKAIETLKTQYNTAAGRVEMVKKSFDEDKKAKKEIVDTRKDELDVITCLADALKSYDRLIVETFQPLTAKQNAMYAMRKALEENSIHSKGITNRMQVLESTISTNEAIINETSTKLPELEQQKTEAVAAKNYKMAGQVTSQIKQLQTKKESASMALASAQEELSGIKSGSAEELAALEAKKAEYEESRRAYLQSYYDLLRSNAITLRRASRTIESVTRGDDTFRFACQALAGSLFDITNNDLTAVADQLGLPHLGDQDDEPVSSPVAAQAAPDAPAAPAAPAASPAASASSAAEGKEGELTAERAQELAALAEAQMESKNNELDVAMGEEKYELCDTLSAESEALETYAAELKKFASGAVTEVPVAPPCFDPNFASKSAGEDMFAGM